MLKFVLRLVSMQVLVLKPRFFRWILILFCMIFKRPCGCEIRNKKTPPLLKLGPISSSLILCNAWTILSVEPDGDQY